MATALSALARADDSPMSAPSTPEQLVKGRSLRVVGA